MAFTSFRFLIFFPCVFLLYYALPFKYRKYMLLVASYYFYMCWRADFIFLILFSTCIDYFCGRGIEKHRENRRVANALLCVSMCMNLGLLFFFKYLNFFGQSLNAVFHFIAIPFSVPVLKIILPVGISFYTFQTMSYTIDVWSGKMDAEKDFVTFALFVSFFPQLVAGPIERAANLLPQLKQEHPFCYENAAYGLKLMAWGFFKKLVIADRLAATFVDDVYRAPEQYAGWWIVLATVAFAFQIYCDFSGYSDIARGCAKTMGIDLMVNFRQPYLYANNIADFWQRWHISLSSWFEEYIFEPMTWNAKDPARMANFALFTVFLASGIWHGAAWTFVVWGLLHAAYRLIGKATRKKRNRLYKKLGINTRNPLFKIGQTGITFALVCFSYVFFRADSIQAALNTLRCCWLGIVAPQMFAATSLHELLLSHKFGILLLAPAFVLLMAFDAVNEKTDPIRLISGLPKALRRTVYILFLLFLITAMPKTSGVPFIYFQF